MNRKYLIIALAIAIIACLSVTVFVIYSIRVGLLGTRTVSRYINTTGIIAQGDLQVYWDVDGTSVMTSLDWGWLDAGGNYNQTAYIKNLGNIPLNVSFSSIDWLPIEASQYITYSCGTEYDLAPNEIREITFDLSIHSDIQTANITQFSFTILVLGEG